MCISLIKIEPTLYSVIVIADKTDPAFPYQASYTLLSYLFWKI